ncbi:beta-ketoacyl-[acyl-carrier-protein] synthase family protein [Taibaiella sp. KBW10]|uniref:beta-ketoacyl-[acyl-carrier-protein] synthase family protein n=1 Tax=Taibaiella sp. KBW10 TaxID=2153357 RepID=UPI000F59EB28|nr:beta-ketoacyl-[acyl-carrier-protein] synthase family protein [Taibaiella sp. KBW10]RQO32297.1 beta-ketoacyl-[acyl-carrier-protein] synthase family protein [Taibaiella sp. KBW10]
MEKSSPAYITGLGIISAIGANVSENRAALEQGQAGIGPATHLKSIHPFPVGEIKYSNKELAEMIGCLDTFPRTALLSIKAAKEAFAPFMGKTEGLNIGLISANTVGGMDLSETLFEAVAERGTFDKRKLWYHECGSITDLTAHALGLEDCWSTSISTACSSSANTIMLGAQLIEQGKMDIVIAGGADSLSKFTLNGFNSLMILDKELCRPFDENRQGLNLGEAAAYVVLMSEKAVTQTNAAKLAILSGYANANDAHHQTASSPDGTGNQLAMLTAIKQSGIALEAIDYINLHGTGTANNDSSEGIAIEKIFSGIPVPDASSTKAYTGHTLGAAGSVEAVFSVLAIMGSKTWPHLRMKTPISGLNWQPNTQSVAKEIRNVLSNSFGFGGNCSALVISKV